MKNIYLKNLEKIEFVVTDSCTGKCKHCSQGEHDGSTCHLDAKICAQAVKIISSQYNIKTVMTFGGEPLLYPETVCSIMNAAFEMNVPGRQIITNGYFSKDVDTVADVVRNLAKSGVNDILLSVDAFHQETIPLDVVRMFACYVKECGIPIRLQPAWLVSSAHNNPYNIRTRQILDSFRDIGAFENAGNIIFPEGNAKRFLSEYFESSKVPVNPYVQDPKDVRCVSFSSNGDVLDSNVYNQDIADILNNYNPY